MTKENPDVEPEAGGDADSNDPVEPQKERRKPGPEERELTLFERDQLRRAAAQLRHVLDSPIRSVLRDFNRTIAPAKFLADVTALGRPTFPDSVIKGALGKTGAGSAVASVLPKIDLPPWGAQVKLINSDVYKMSGLGQPNLVKFSSLLAANADFGFDKTVSRLVGQFAAEQTSLLKTIAPLLSRISTRFYPANLAGIEDLDFAEVEAVVMLDGIALYSVPRTEIAEKLIRATSTSERRTLLGRRWKAIATDCRAALEGCTSVAVAPYVTFSRRALDALEGEHTEAAQTLAASTLDTVVNAYFGKQRYKLTPNRGTTTTEEYEAFTVREFIAVAPLWQAYQKYRTEDGDPIPTSFSRHASVHGVSAKQFSRRNAVQAVLFLSSLLVFLDEEASSSDAA